MSSPTKTIPCDSPNCNKVAGTLSGSSITIICRHHGKRHLTTIALDDLLRLLTEQSDTNVLTDDDKSVLSCAPVVQHHL